MAVIMYRVKTVCHTCEQVFEQRDQHASKWCPECRRARERRQRTESARRVRELHRSARLPVTEDMQIGPDRVFEIIQREWSGQ